MPPFDDDEIDLDKLSTNKNKKPNIGGGQKSMFDQKPKLPSQQEFEQKASEINNKLINYRQMTAEMGLKFKKIVLDKTLPQNKSVLVIDMERELLKDMMKLASQINNDENEKEGEGSLGWIAVLFTTALQYRDRCNVLEYELSNIKAAVNSLQEKLTELKNG